MFSGYFFVPSALVIFRVLSIGFAALTRQPIGSLCAWKAKTPVFWSRSVLLLFKSRVTRSKILLLVEFCPSSAAAFWSITCASGLVLKELWTVDGDIEEAMEAMALSAYRDSMGVFKVHEVPGHILEAACTLVLPFKAGFSKVLSYLNNESPVQLAINSQSFELGSVEHPLTVPARG
jgi:hypothetical protein